MKNKANGFTLIETLVSLSLINFLVIIIWSLFISYQFRLDEINIQAFLIQMTINYQEIHLADPLFFDNPDNMLTFGKFEEIEIEKYEKSYFYYYNKHLEIVPKELAIIKVRITHQILISTRKSYWLIIDSYNLNLNDKESNLFYFSNFYLSKLATTWLGDE